VTVASAPGMERAARAMAAEARVMEPEAEVRSAEACEPSGSSDGTKKCEYGEHPDELTVNDH
jgi:hypothetical protein